ncbi:MAG: twin transmembrane helix small protein [Tagaea sp.]|nr:twin transmembrane helix small protein [Azospirillum sp.]MCA3266247.1 twin transmembrane helix small protein [Azospirillum sp.]MCZ8122304.1 twin transmembrane helix small protein [Magnetospirillum sp.]
MEIVLLVLPYLIGAVCLGVVLSLFTGLGGMAQGGQFNRRHGNRMMRWRVGLQLLAVILLVTYVSLRRAAG